MLAESRTVTVLHEPPSPPNQTFLVATDLAACSAHVNSDRYKLKLCDKTAGRFQQLVTQMRWRLDEGDGTAIYMVGVTDAGLMVGIPERDFDKSTQTLFRMAKANHAGAVVKTTWMGPNGRGGQVVVTNLPEESHRQDERVVFIGDAQSGKSSLAAVLSSTEIDDGRGRARLDLFRHGHEIRSGRTSSIGAATMAFDEAGGFISPKQSRKQFNSKSVTLPAYPARVPQRRTHIPTRSLAHTIHHA